MKDFEKLFLNYMTSLCEAHPDPSHDILHVKRVVAMAKALAEKENADLNIVIPAAYLHDCVYISKADDRRSQASRLSAEKAGELLQQWEYPSQFHAPIQHAIAAHSFSANIKAETLEAQIVQDADRLDAMGAIGIFRCFAFSGLSGRPLYYDGEPFAESRQLDDSQNTLDHFYVKLLSLQDRLNTETAKQEGVRRLEVLRSYLNDLRCELSVEL